MHSTPSLPPTGAAPAPLDQHLAAPSANCPQYQTQDPPIPHSHACLPVCLYTCPAHAHLTHTLKSLASLSYIVLVYLLAMSME